MKRTSLGAIFSMLILALACGGKATVGTGDNQGNDDDESRDASSKGDDDNEDDDRGRDNDDDNNDDDTIINNTPPPCRPATCESLGAQCGLVPDGCEGFLDCDEEAGGCEGNDICRPLEEGSMVLVCRNPEDDAEGRLTKEEACGDQECGSAGDGLDGVYECGEGCDEDTQRCDHGECVDLVTTDNCPTLITSCAEANDGEGVSCGFTGNGCGGLLDCTEELGGCPGGQICEHGECTVATCQPKPAEEVCGTKNCGFESNGCGVEVEEGVVSCGTCDADAGEFCGGGGPDVCGVAEAECADEATACGDRECGIAGDGCGGSFTCGSGCSGDNVCSGGECIPPPCEALTQAAACAGLECGSVSDGCDGIIECGSCPTGQACHVPTPHQCDVPPSNECIPDTPEEACAGRECGLTFDGCNFGLADRIDCTAVNGGCGAGEFCGLVAPNQCDTPPQQNDCTADERSCAALGWACGTAVNRCGETFPCAAEGRSCIEGFEICQGGITGPTECINIFDQLGEDCDVCNAIPNCTNQDPTRVTGRVITPGRTNGNTPNQVGVPNAFVYILRNNDESQIPAITTGIPEGGTSCDRCEDQAPTFGPVLAGATSDAEGRFTLEGLIPVDQEFVLVTKVGRFRRAQKVTLPASAACAETALPENAAANPTRLPRTMTDGLAVNIPRIAISTGSIDAMECVFEKIGIAATEFANGSATTTGPRIHLYRGGSGTQGARVGNVTGTPDTDLYSSLARLQSYDMLVADCEGGNWDGQAQDWGAAWHQRDANGPNVREYLNRGGRMFASHLSFSWLRPRTGDPDSNLAYDPGTFARTGLGGAATWENAARTAPNTGTGIISLNRPNASPRIEMFRDWLFAEAVTATLGGNFSITEPRSQVAMDDPASLGAFSEEFVHCTGNSCAGANNASRTQQFSFNTPYGAPAAASCGRVAYSGFHVAGADGGATVGANTQFPGLCGASLTNQEKVLLFMLFDLGACTGTLDPPACTPVACPDGACGLLPDGCGGTQVCQCPTDEVCFSVSGQIAGECRELTCTPQECPAEFECGFASDGCGAALNCGQCPANSDCVGNRCVTPCTPATACPAGRVCGYSPDGCGGLVSCGQCPQGQVCNNGVCGQVCTPQACSVSNPNFQCGVTSDGCSGVVSCGDCTPPAVCGGGGVANQCGFQCNPLTCSQRNVECGWVGDGCGAAIDCGVCPPGEVCGLRSPNQCDGCVPRTTCNTGECGRTGDGCGGTIQCTPCDIPNCTPTTCSQSNPTYECGFVSDGCGDAVSCGMHNGGCPPGEICGLVTPFMCDPPPPCPKRTCAQQNANCGSVADGCGGLLECGDCPEGPPPQFCGFHQPNRCGNASVF